MRKSKKLVAGILACMMMALTCLPVSAEEPPVPTSGEEEIMPLFDNFAQASSALTISSLGRATGGGTVTGTKSYTYTLTCTIQKISGSSVTHIKSWTTSKKGPGTVALPVDYYLSSRGTYRLRTYVSVKNSSGTVLETHTVYSPTDTY